MIEEFRANGGKTLGRFAGTELLLLHTKGARTGDDRLDEILNGLVYGDEVVVRASSAGAVAHDYDAQRDRETIYQEDEWPALLVSAQSRELYAVAHAPSLCCSYTAFARRGHSGLRRNIPLLGNDPLTAQHGGVLLTVLRLTVGSIEDRARACCLRIQTRHAGNLGKQDPMPCVDFLKHNKAGLARCSDCS